jgi:small ligand-binding sensory domain FIST
VAEDGQSGAVSADPAVVLDHQGAVDGVGDFAVAVVAALDDQRDAITVGDLVHPGPQHFDDRSQTQLAVRPASPFRLIMYVLDAASYVIEYFVGYRPVFWYSCGSFRSLVTVGLPSK